MGLLLSWRRWFAATAGKLQGPVCLASTNSCLTYELGANQRNMHLRSPFQKLSISLKSWHLLKWASQKWVSPIVSHCTMEPHRNQKPLKQILFHFFHCFVLSPYFRYFFYWEKRKFGEFQHQLDLEEQEGSLLVLMLLLAAILSENMSFLGNQVQLYLRQQISRVGKAYTVTTHRWVNWNNTIESLHF